MKHILLRRLQSAMAMQRRSLVAILGSAVALSAIPVPAAGQDIVGRLIDLYTANPVMGVTVQLVDLDHPANVKRVVRTDTAGRFTIDPPEPGIYRLKYFRFGYQPLTSIPMVVNDTQAVTISASIMPDPAMLDAITSFATAAMGGVYFESRLASGLGRILTRDDIQAGSYTDVPAIIRDAPGASAELGRDGQRWSLSLQTQSAAKSNCRPALFMNGSRLNGLDGEYSEEATDMILGIPITAVWAIEIYGSVSSIPGIYQGSDMACGVLALWTQRPG